MPASCPAAPALLELVTFRVLLTLRVLLMFVMFVRL